MCATGGLARFGRVRGYWCLLTFVLLISAGHVVHASDVDDLKTAYKQVAALESKGKFREAIPLAEQLLAKAEKVYVNNPEHTKVFLDLLANLYKQQGRYSEAMPLLTRSLQLCEKTKGPNHLEYVTCLNDLAWIYVKNGNSTEAEPLYIRALQIAEKVQGPNHSSVGAIVNNLATLYSFQSRYPEAESCYKRSLKLSEINLEPENLSFATCLCNLAITYDHQGRYSDAEQACQRSLRIREKLQAPDHPDVALGLCVLANIYEHQARYADSELLNERSLKIREKQLGPDHPDVAESLTNMALLYKRQGRFSEAEPLYQRALKIREKLGPDHPYLATCLNNLAALYMELGRFSEAEPLYQRALKSNEKSLGSDHAGVATILNNISHLYELMDRYSEAEVVCRRSLRIREKLLGPDHPDVGTSLVNLAYLESHQGHHSEAEKLYQRAIKSGEKVLGPDHPIVAGRIGKLANLYCDQDRVSEAETLYQRSLKLHEKALGPDHPDVASILHSLADVYVQQNRISDAEPLVERAIVILDRASMAPIQRYYSYLLRSRIAWALNDRGSAFNDLRKAMDLAESQRSRTAGTERERAGVFSRLQEAFELMIARQLELGTATDHGEVVTTIERTRARSLLDDLSFAGTNLDLGRTSVERESLLQQEGKLKSRVAELEKKYESARTEAERKQLLLELADAREAVYQQYREQRSSNPIYRNLLSTAAGPPRLRQLQRTLTPDKSLMLVYYLGKNAGYVVSIKSDQAHLSELTVDKKLAKDLNCDAGPLTARQMKSILMNDQQNGLMQKLADPNSSRTITPALAALWTVLIPEAQRVQIQSGELKRLLIIPDASLSNLPFEALVVNADAMPTYLIDVAPPIQYAPSMTVLYNLQQRPIVKADPKTKPVLTVGNPRYGNSGPVKGDSLAMLSAGTRYAQRGGHLQPLPFSGTESAWVYDSFTSSGIGVGRLLQSDATEANVRFNVPGRRVIHFACHGLVDQEYGNFFGSLAVTPGPKAKDTPSDDGFLTLAEICQLDLKTCELAILSACETNFGPQQRGEGSWALSRGFLVAGARRVVASNWLVDDEAAASLISYYCGGLARDEKQGQTPDYAARLHAAKRWIRQQDKWSSPYFWAPFILMGPN